MGMEHFVSALNQGLENYSPAWLHSFSIKVYWNIAIPVHLHIICGCFGDIMAEPKSWRQWLNNRNLKPFSIWPFKEKVSLLPFQINNENWKANTPASYPKWGGKNYGRRKCLRASENWDLWGVKLCWSSLEETSRVFMAMHGAFPINKMHSLELLWNCLTSRSFWKIVTLNSNFCQHTFLKSRKRKE